MVLSSVALVASLGELVLSDGNLVVAAEEEMLDGTKEGRSDGTLDGTRDGRSEGTLDGDIDES